MFCETCVKPQSETWWKFGIFTCKIITKKWERTTKISNSENILSWLYKLTDCISSAYNIIKS